MTIKTDIKNEKLTKHDRCDGCGAQAYVWVKGVSGELMFCGHHFTKIMAAEESAEAMKAFAFEVIDQRGEEI